MFVEYSVNQAGDLRDVGFMSGHRRRRWLDIDPALRQRLVLDSMMYYLSSTLPGGIVPVDCFHPTAARLMSSRFPW